MRLGIIGSGTMAGTVLDALVARNARLGALICLTSPRGAAAARNRLSRWDGPVQVTQDVTELLRAKPDLVVECAGHGAVRDYGEAILRDGVALGLASAGALSDEKLHQALLAAAIDGGTRLHIIPGAIGGIDVLAAAKLAGLDEVTYISRKPPLAWKGTPATGLLNAAEMDTPQIFFNGTARDAAIVYPQNANVAATVALAGLGFERTRVQLIADPGVARNVHELHFVSRCVEVGIRLEGVPSPGNPKTSLTAGYSLARFVLNHLQHEVV